MVSHRRRPSAGSHRYVATAAVSLQLGGSIAEADGSGAVDRHHHGADSGVLTAHSDALLKAMLSRGAAASLVERYESLISVVVLI
jgi:hypothetical protein